MPYWKCFYHVIWATKHREPIIEPAFESVIFATIRQKAERFKSVIYAVNGVGDHIHVVASIPPSIALATWVGEIKGSSARAVNTSFELESLFRWQAGYGILTFGEKYLQFVTDYVHHQKDHHSNLNIIKRMEQIEE